MSEPIVFIARLKVKEGKLEDYKKNFQNVVNFVKPNKPNTVVFLNYTTEDDAEATLIQVYPSADAMEQHVQGLAEIARKSYESMDILSFEIYGNPTDTTLTTMKNLAATGVGVKISPHFNGGFIRPQSAG
jgi:quinol monooxygenase YgiN